MHIVVPDEYRYLYVHDREHPIVKIPAEVLRQAAKPVVKVNNKTGQLVDELIKQMKRANGVGLAAPQLGILQRVIVIAPDGNRPTGLINPVIVRSDGSQVGQEGCLSIPGLYGDVERAMYVKIEAMDKRGRKLTFEMEGMPARVVLHEIDHLDGVLFTDKVIVSTLHWMVPEGAPEPPLPTVPSR